MIPDLIPMNIEFYATPSPIAPMLSDDKSDDDSIDSPQV